MSSPKDPAPSIFTLDIGGMTCASCVSRVEKALNRIPGVEAASINLATEQARVRLKANSDTTIDSLITSVEKTGYSAKLSTPHGGVKTRQTHAFWGSDGLGKVLFSFALSTPLFLPMLLMPFGVHWSLSPTWQLLLATPVQFLLGGRFYRAGFNALLAGVGNMDLLVALGTSAAYGLSVYQMIADAHASHELYFEGSSVIISMVLLGKWLEARAKQQTTEAIRALQKLWPENARVLNPHIIVGEGSFLKDYRELALEQVLPKDKVLVLPGERIPVDGVIVFGNSHVDESLLTGESEPIKKSQNAKVIGGSLNGEGVLVVEAQTVGVESVLSQIITLVEDAQTQKAPIQKLVDQVSAIFVPSVIVITLLTGMINWLYLDSISLAILRAVSVLVIACPCALGLATPAAIMAGTGVAARFGILIKDPQVLELAHRLNIVAFDKTGTLTIGKPRMLAFIPMTNAFDINMLLATAAGLQMGSEHPLAKALLEAAELAEVAPNPPTESKALPGIGVYGKPSLGPLAGQEVTLQSLASLSDSPNIRDVLEKSASLLGVGQTISVLMHQDIPLAIIGFGDEVKPNANKAIASLHQMHIRTVMVSGDNTAAADRIGQSIGIDSVYAQILPGNKAQIIKALQSGEKNHSRQYVAMVGDGVNDAPALAAADVGMAMSTGSDVAMQAAGITLMRGDPSLVSEAIDISKRTWKKIQQNLFWAFAFNSIGIPLAALGYLSPMLAGSAMALSSFCVLSNALLLKRWRPSHN